MGRSRSRSPRYRDRDRRRRSRSPRRRSRSPRRRRRSRSPLGDSLKRPRSPGRGAMHGRGGYGEEKRKREDGQFKTPQDAQIALTLGGSLGVNTRKKKKKPQSKPTLAPIQPEDVTDEDKMMQELMGFSGFDTTKGKKVKNNDIYAINRKVERKYRQYMNRKGGFNRPLEFMQ